MQHILTHAGVHLLHYCLNSDINYFLLHQKGEREGGKGQHIFVKCPIFTFIFLFPLNFTTTFIHHHLQQHLHNCLHTQPPTQPPTQPLTQPPTPTPTPPPPQPHHHVIFLFLEGGGRGVSEQFFMSHFLLSHSG